MAELKAEYTLSQILERQREITDKAFAEGRQRGFEEAFALITSELEAVKELSIFYVKPGLGTALAVVRNTGNSTSYTRNR